MTLLRGVPKSLPTGTAVRDSPTMVAKLFGTEGLFDFDTPRDVHACLVSVLIIGIGSRDSSHNYTMRHQGVNCTTFK
jgi:hypothetical protein